MAEHHETAPADTSNPRPITSADIVAHIRETGSAATLVNVWATWCQPCREEFPDLVRFQREWRERGVEVMYVSADFDDQLDQVRKFLASHGVTDPTYLKHETDMKFIDGLDARWTGALPATFVYDRAGKVVRYWEGRADYARFVAAAEAAIQGAGR